MGFWKKVLKFVAKATLEKIADKLARRGGKK